MEATESPQPAPPKADNKNVLLLIGVGGGVLGLLLMCCCGIGGAWWMMSRGAEGRLIGKWNGSGTLMFMNATATIEFRSNGRVDFSRSYDVMPGAGGSGSGDWSVEEVEGDRIALKVAADVDPENPVGWVIFFDGNDKFTIAGFDDMEYTFTRAP
jgi:hypothetical protein